MANKFSWEIFERVESPKVSNSRGSSNLFECELTFVPSRRSFVAELRELPESHGSSNVYTFAHDSNGDTAACTFGNVPTLLSTGTKKAFVEPYSLSAEQSNSNYTCSGKEWPSARKMARLAKINDCAASTSNYISSARPMVPKDINTSPNHESQPKQPVVNDIRHGDRIAVSATTYVQHPPTASSVVGQSGEANRGNLNTSAPSHNTQLDSNGRSNVPINSIPQKCSVVPYRKGIAFNVDSSSRLNNRKRTGSNGHMNGIVKNGWNHKDRLIGGSINGKFEIMDMKKFFANIRYPKRNLELRSTWENCKYMPSNGRQYGSGLYNKTTYCYVNSVLQIVTHNPLVARYLMEIHLNWHFQFKKKHGVADHARCFICELGLHIRRSIKYGDSFQPDWIYPFVAKMFPRRFDSNQEDAHEFLTLMCDQIQKNANRLSKEGIKNDSHYADLESLPDQVFGGLLLYRSRCLQCSNFSEHYERFREISIALDSPNSSLDELIQRHFSPERMPYKCDRCMAEVELERKAHILNAPKVLVIQLKRFDSYGRKLTHRVNFQLSLRVDRFLFKKNAHVTYSLNGFVQHFGSTLAFGHYIAVVRGFSSTTWHSFDDDTHCPIKEMDLHKYEPYLLVYNRDTPTHT